MQVWDGNTDARITFDWAQSAQASRTIAMMTENANLTQALLTRLSELSNTPLSIFQNSTVSNIANGTDTPDVDLSSWPVLTLSSASPSSSTQTPPSIAARLLIGADGVNSPVRKYAGITTRGWDYDRHGVVATLTTTPSDDSLFKATTTAYQRFLPALGGPIALLPFPNAHASLVWSTTPQNASYLKSLPPKAFTSMVNAAFRLPQVDLKYMLTLPAAPSPSQQSHASELSWRLQHTPPSPATSIPWVASLQPHTLASFPLRHLHATTYTNPRVALAGDAAHTVHPLAGQGLNLGLGDVKVLAATIAEAVEVGADIGDVMALEKYGRERWGVNALVGGVCDGLHKLYSHDGGVFTWGRTLGLGIVENVPLLKGMIMGAAEGR
jgi:ubiquinone biosynthesis monooxygenase Coq6